MLIIDLLKDYKLKLIERIKQDIEHVGFFMDINQVNIADMYLNSATNEHKKLTALDKWMEQNYGELIKLDNNCTCDLPLC